MTPRTLVVLLLCLALAACAAATPHPLLKENPQAMSDAGILRYYYDLDAAIRECEQTDTRPRVGVGGATGSYGSGVGVGVGFPMGASCDASDLRQRQAEVRLELSKRGLEP